MTWLEAKALLEAGKRVMRQGWCWCWLQLDADGERRVHYEDGKQKPTKYRLYKSDERATDWMEWQS